MSKEPPSSPCIPLGGRGGGVKGGFTAYVLLRVYERGRGPKSPGGYERCVFVQEGVLGDVSCGLYGLA